MDEKQIQFLWDNYASKGKGFKDLSEFKELISDDSSRKTFFEFSNKDLGFKDYDEFESVIGVKKKEQAAKSGQPSQVSFQETDVQPIAEVGGYEVPKFEKDTVYAGELPEVQIEAEAPTLDWWKSTENTKENFTQNLKKLLPQLGLFTSSSFEKIIGKEASNWLYGLPAIDIDLETGDIKLIDGRTIDEARNKAIDELTELQSRIKPTIGIVESIENFDVPGVAAGVINAASDMVTTAIPAAITGGASIPIQTMGQSFYDYNKAKADAKGISLNELLDRGEGDYTVPMAVGTVSTALEYIGYKGMAASINRKLASQSGQRVAATLFSDYNKEGLTEWMQSGLEVYNQALGSGKSQGEATELAVDEMFSKRGLEAYASGLAGSAVAGGGARLVKRGLTPVANRAIKSLESAKDALYRDLANPNIPSEAKDKISDELLSIDEQIDETVNTDNKIARNIPSESLSRVQELEDNIQKVEDALVSESVSDISKNALIEKRNDFQKELESILKQGEDLAVRETSELSDILKEIDSLSEEYNRLADIANEQDRSIGKPKTKEQQKASEVQARLIELYKQRDAIQEQTTSQVPVQPEARVGEEVAEGKPEAEPEAIAEGVQEEVTSSSLSKNINKQISKLNKILNKQKAGIINYNERNIKDIKGTQTSTIDTEEYEELSEEIKNNGVVPILIDKKTGMVIDGNHRLTILRKMGINNIPVFEIDGDFFEGSISGDNARMEFLSEYSGTTPLVPVQPDLISSFDSAKTKKKKREIAKQIQESVSPEELASVIEQNPQIESFLEKVEPEDNERVKAFELMDKIDSDVRKRQRVGAETKTPELDKKLFEATTNALQQTKWYESADDTARENAIRELSVRYGQKIKRAPSPESAIRDFAAKRGDELTISEQGPKMVTVDDAKMLDIQLRLRERAAKEGFEAGKKSVKEKVAAYNAIVKEGREALSNLIKSSKSTVFKGYNVRGTSAYRMLRRVNDAKTPLQLDRALDYVKRSIADIDYQNKVNTAKKLTDSIKSSIGNLPINLQESIAALAKQNPKRSEDLVSYNNVMAGVLTSVRSKGEFPINQAGIDAVKERIYKNNLEDKIERLKSIYPELKKAIIKSVKDMESIVSAYDSINLEETTDAKPSKPSESRAAMEAINELLQDELASFDTDTLSKEDKEFYDALVGIDVASLNNKQLTFLNNAINNFIENGSFDGVGQYILNEYRLQQIYTPEFTKDIQNSIVKLNSISKSMADYRTLAVKLKAIVKKSEDAVRLRIGTGLNKHDMAYTAFENKMDEVMANIEALSKKFGIYDSYDSVIKLGVFSDLLQHKEGATPEQIQKEYEDRSNALRAGIANAEVQASRSMDYKEKNGPQIEAVKKVLSNYVDKAQTPAELEAMLTKNEAKFRDIVLSQFSQIRPELEMLSKVYKNKSFDKISSYFPRTYVYPKVVSGELSRVSERILEMSTFSGKENLDTDVSTAFDERLLNNGKLPKDAMVNYDFLGVFQNEYRKQLYDAKTTDTRSLIAQAISSKQLEEAINNDDDLKDYIQQSFDSRIRNEKNGLYSRVDESWFKAATAFVLNSANKIALGGILSPWFKQVFPGLTSTMINTSDLPESKGNLNMVTDAIVTISENPKAFNEFISKSPVSRRHKQQAQFISQGMIEGSDFRMAKDKITRGIKWWDKKTEDIFMTSLKKGDMTGAGISFVSYYKYYLLKNNIIKNQDDFDFQEHALNPNQEAYAYAEQMTSQVLNVNTSVEKPNKQILRGWLPFISFAVNSMSTAAINTNRIFLYNEARGEAARQLAARVAESVAINTISGGLRILFITAGSSALSEIVRYLVSDDEEEKKILDSIAEYTESYVEKTWANVNTYITSDIFTGQIAENIVMPVADLGINYFEELSAVVNGERYAREQKPVRPGEAFKLLGKYGIYPAKMYETGQNLVSFIRSQDGYFLPQKYGYISIDDDVRIPLSKSKEKAPDWAKYSYLFATISNAMSLGMGGSFSEFASISRRLPGITAKTITEVYGKDNGFSTLIKKDDNNPYGYSKLEMKHATIDFNKIEYFLNPEQLKQWNAYRRKWYKENYDNMLKEALAIERQINPLLNKGDKFDAFDFVDRQLVDAANSYANAMIISKYATPDGRLKLNLKEDVKKEFKKKK